jgi:HPt (histidine-containing phosphotransfer) domain-containing protein
MTATSKDGIPLGFDDLLIKPFTPGDLLQCCEGLWSGKSSGRIKTPQSLAMKPSIAIATFDRMKSSMPLPQLRALYDFALSDAESRIVRLSTATEIGDDISYRREAHALKGSCGMIGAVRLGSLAAVAEDEGLPAATVTELNPIQHFHAEMEQIRHMLESLLPSAS